MANETDQHISVIAKLVKLTQQGKLKWRTITDFGSITKDPSEQIQSAFIATYKSTQLRILKKKCRVEDYLASFLHKTSDWVTAFDLQMIDENGFEIWTFPEAAVTKDLFAAVQYQVADVKGFIDDVLNEN